MELWQRDGAGIDALKRDGMTWGDIAQRFGTTIDAVRKRHRRWAFKSEASHLDPPPPHITGHTAKDESEEIDEDEVWADALRYTAKQKAQASKAVGKLTFEKGPIALVAMADLHLGGWGVDYEELDEDVSLILGTPGMYVVLNGDLLDNFIVGRLEQLRKTEAPFTITEEWTLVKRILKRLAPKLVASCSGNHDLWTFSSSGIDYLADIHASITPNILYHKYDLRFDVQVGDFTQRWRVRHKWHGHSQYNPLHGVTKASKFDKSVDYDVGVAAHTHAAGLWQEFLNGDKTGYAVLCGSYKLADRYKMAQGFPEANGRTAVTTIIDEDGHVYGTNDLEAAATLMSLFYQDTTQLVR